jgi:hypothetical protein
LLPYSPARFGGCGCAETWSYNSALSQKFFAIFEAKRALPQMLNRSQNAINNILSIEYRVEKCLRGFIPLFKETPEFDRQIIYANKIFLSRQCE